MSNYKSAVFGPDILNAFRDNLCVLDSAGDIIAVNESWIRFASENNGVITAVGTGVNYLQVCDNAMGADRTSALEFAAGIREVIACRKQVFTMEYECSSNTEERWFSGRVTSFRDSASDDLKILIIHENITEKRKTELELRKLILAVEQSPSTVVITDLKGNIEYVNPKFVELTGYSFQEARGKNPRILKSGKTPAHVYKDMWSSIKSGRIWRGTFLNKNRNGSLYWESAVISPIFNDKGGIINYMAVKEDITDRKQAETVLQMRLDLLIFSASHTLNESLREVLDAVCLLMDSPIGFYHFVEDDETSINLQVWSTRTMKEFCKAAGAGTHYNIDSAGVWVDCVREKKAVIHNDYASLKHKRGLPEGHAEVIRELVVPVIRDDKVRAILGIGNRAGDYSENDARVVTFFADLAWVITERKRAEDSLRYQALLLENVSDAIISTDINFKVKTWNRGSEELYGISEKEAVGKNVRSLFTTEYIINKYENVLKDFMGAGSWQGEVVQVLKNGKQMNIMSSVTLLKDSSGAPDGAVAVNRDITEKKRIEHGIMREYNLNAALSEIYEPMMKSDISIADIAKIILYWARYLTSSEHGFVSTIDRSTGNLISHTLTEMLEGGCGIPDDKKAIVFTRDPHGKFQSLFGYSLNTGEAVYTNAPASHPASSGIPEGHIPLKNYLSVPVFVEDEIGGLIAVSNSENDYTEDDMTAVRRLAGYYAIAIKRQRDIEKLENAKLFAEAANRAKSGFIASMSHELRTPLNSILGFSQLLEMKTSGELNSDQMEYVGYIRSSGSHLLDMINEILDLAKIEAGKIEIKKKPFDLAELLNGFPERMKALSLKKNITVKISVAEDIGTLDADELRIRQILFNLLSNAVKFTEPERNIGIEAYPDECNAVITVWDEGQGIAERDHERIFSPFEQAGSMEESLKGTGLGLSITRKLVELHGGRIVLDSAPGKGSRFTVILPGRGAKVSSSE